MATSLMRKKFAALFKRGDNATTADAKGDALEEIVVCLFSTTKGVPGGLIRRNELNKQVSQEIDIAIWNDRHPQGLPFLPDTVVAECKNWDAPVGSSAIDAFVAKLKDRMCDVGILVAASGITGDARDLSSAHERIANALSHGVKIIVLTRTEILAIGSSGAFVKLLKQKLTLLAASRTSIE